MKRVWVVAAVVLSLTWASPAFAADAPELDWVAWVNRPQTPKEEAAILRSLTHGRPSGSDAWTARAERRLGLGPLRPRGRPKGWRKAKAKGK